MKNSLYILAIAMLIWACGTSKKSGNSPTAPTGYEFTDTLSKSFAQIKIPTNQEWKVINRKNITAQGDEMGVVKMDGYFKDCCIKHRDLLFGEGDLSDHEALKKKALFLAPRLLEYNDFRFRTKDSKLINGTLEASIITNNNGQKIVLIEANATEDREKSIQYGYKIYGRIYFYLSTYQGKKHKHFPAIVSTLQLKPEEFSSNKKNSFIELTDFIAQSTVLNEKYKSN